MLNPAPNPSLYLHIYYYVWNCNQFAVLLHYADSFFSFFYIFCTGFYLFIFFVDPVRRAGYDPRCSLPLG